MQLQHQCLLLNCLLVEEVQFRKRVRTAFGKLAKLLIAWNRERQK